MPLPPHAAEWMHLADLDYIGPFVKAWAAFNAWYREASAQGTERAMLDFVATQPNRARRRILPLLDGGNATADAMILKQAICDLHQCLDSIQFEVTRKAWWNAYRSVRFASALGHYNTNASSGGGRSTSRNACRVAG